MRQRLIAALPEIRVGNTGMLMSENLSGVNVVYFR
jgi:hypothetical protein